MISTLLMIFGGAWGLIGVAGTVLRFGMFAGLASTLSTAFPLVVKVLDFAADSFIAVAKFLGKGAEACLATGPGVIFLVVTFLAGGYFDGDWRPFRSKAPVEKVETAKPAKRSSSPVRVQRSETTEERQAICTWLPVVCN